MTAGVYLYLLLAMMFALLVRGFVSGGGVRPTFIYALVMMFYPMVTLAINEIGLMPLYPWVPTYSDKEFVMFAQISLAAITPIYLVVFVTAKSLTPLQLIQVRTLNLYDFERRFFLLVLLFYFAYVAINANHIFFSGYREFQKTGYKFMAAMDYLVFFSLLIRVQLVDVSFSKYEKSALAVYFLIKLLAGGRMFMVTIGLVLLVYYLVRNRPGPSSVRKLLGWSPLVVLLMGFAVLAREKSLNFMRVGFSMSQEYLNASMSALQVSSAAVEGRAAEHLDMLFDPILSMVPSAIYERENFAYFSFIEEEYGGMKGYNPIGGSYLPHEVFLIYPSLIFVFLYFLMIALVLYRIERSLLSSTIVKLSALGLSIRIAMLSVFLVFSVRHYHYVHAKTVVMIVAFTSVFYLASVLVSGVLKFSVMGNAGLHYRIRTFAPFRRSEKLGVDA